MKQLSKQRLYKEIVSWFRYDYCTFGSTVNQPQQEPKYDMAVCHALVSRTDHKGRMGDVQTGEIQKNRVLLLGGVNDSKTENMAPRPPGFRYKKRQAGRKFKIRFHLKRNVSIFCKSRHDVTIHVMRGPYSHSDPTLVEWKIRQGYLHFINFAIFWIVINKILPGRGVAFPPPHPAFTTGYKVNFTFINNTP